MVFSEGAGVFPVAEPVGIMSWISSTHGHEGEHKQHTDQDDFAAREPKLGLAISSDVEQVDSTRNTLDTILNRFGEHCVGTRCFGRDTRIQCDTRSAHSGRWNVVSPER
jgi:hypothetical protein